MVATDLSLPDEAHKHIVFALYRAFLQREPDTEGLRAYLGALQDGLTLQELVSAFLNSPEFQTRLPQLISLYPMDSAPAIPVDVNITPEERRTLWNKVADAWSTLGEQDPYWSVLTGDEYRIGRMGKEAIDAFYETGRNEVTRMSTWLERNGCSIPANGTCVDYGCGVGRVTLWLARTFRRVIAVDISESHITRAREYLTAKNIDNVEFYLLRGEESLQVTRGADFFFSFIVLQHNPPPIIMAILTTVLGGMRADGLAFFQVPTYMSGYEFNVARYIKSPTSGKGMEMHLLPQSEIFRIAHLTNCRSLEVQPDWLTGMWGAWISNTFLLRKIATDSKTETSWWGSLGELGNKSRLAKKLRHLGRHKNDAEVINAAYRGVLGRHADLEGMQHYSRLLKKNNYDLASVLRDLLSSEEFVERFGARCAERAAAIPRGAHRDEWIYAGYRALLGRDPDPVGLETYRSELSKPGHDLRWFLDCLVGSDEFQIKNSVVTPSELPNLTLLLPDYYEPGPAAGGTTPFVFKGAEDSDINMMDRLIHKHRYYDNLGVWSPRIDIDKRVIAAIVRGLGAGRCLEIGCFSGPVLSLLDEAGVEVTGIDASHLAFVLAYPNVRDKILFGDLLSIQIDGPYNVVLCMDILEHLNPLSLSKYLQKISSILDRNGYVYMNSPIFGRDDIFGEVFPQTLEEWKIVGDAGFWRHWECDEKGWPMHGHLIWASTRWWEDQFREHGLIRDRDVEMTIHETLNRFFDVYAPARRALFALRPASSSRSSRQVSRRITEMLGSVEGLPL